MKNGPNIAKCDGVVMEAMHNYWRKKCGGRWHFFRTCVLEQLRLTKNFENKEHSVSVNKFDSKYI